MNRLMLPVAFGVLMLAAVAARADSMEDSIVRQLHDQGYTSVDVRRTLLGRLLIVAEGGDQVREIVINPSTGEIMRDYLRPLRAFGDGGGGRRDVASAGGQPRVDVPDRPVKDVVTSDFGDAPEGPVE